MRRWAFGFVGEELEPEFGEGRIAVLFDFVAEAGTVNSPEDDSSVGRGGTGGTGGKSLWPLPAATELGRLGILG